MLAWNASLMLPLLPAPGAPPLSPPTPFFRVSLETPQRAARSALQKRDAKPKRACSEQGLLRPMHLRQSEAERGQQVKARLYLVWQGQAIGRGLLPSLTCHRA